MREGEEFGYALPSLLAVLFSRADPAEELLQLHSREAAP
jgi:hypothetical protein